tara:strand:+ start:2768 stop:3061 length:294 start_codon:yes stop_codon:yes gene_type:complete
MTQIVLFGSIFNRVRPSKEWLNGFGKLFHCPMCMGFWVGIFLFGINGLTELFNFDYNLVNAFLLGCLSSGTTYLISVLIDDFGFKIRLSGEIKDEKN